MQSRIAELEASLEAARLQAQENYSALQSMTADRDNTVADFTSRLSDATNRIAALESEAKSAEVRAAELVAARFGSDPAAISDDEPTNSESDNELAAKIRSETNSTKRAELYARWKTLTNKK